MRFYKAGYWLYAGARTALRATGLVKLVRRRVGVSAARWITQASANATTPLRIRGHRMFISPQDGYASPDMIGDRYEVATTRLFEQVVQPGQTVVDIGAHVGYYSLLAARRVGPQGRVYAFEPEPKNHVLLLKNIALNGYANIVPVPLAVSDRTGVSDLFLGGMDTGFHSLFELHLPHPSDPGKVAVNTTTLDAFFEARGWPSSVDVIKMDIEGAELHALEGMREFLSRMRQCALIIEFCPWILQTLGVAPEAFLARLGELGFQLSVIERRGAIPLESTDRRALIERLLQRDGYTNLLGIRGAASTALPAARRPEKVDASGVHKA